MAGTKANSFHIAISTWASITIIEMVAAVGSFSSTTLLLICFNYIVTHSRENWYLVWSLATLSQFQSSQLQSPITFKYFKLSLILLSASYSSALIITNSSNTIQCGTIFDTCSSDFETRTQTFFCRRTDYFHQCDCRSRCFSHLAKYFTRLDIASNLCATFSLASLVWAAAVQWISTLYLEHQTTFNWSQRMVIAVLQNPKV